MINSMSNKVKIIIFQGSTRDNSQSRKVSEYLENMQESIDFSAEIIDLYQLNLPIYDDTKEGKWSAKWNPVLDKIKESDGFIFVSPEWDGMASVGILNMLHYVPNDSMAHKPVMLVGVSNGRGGSYPLAQMKQMGPKNKHYVISPENLIFGDVEKVLVDGEVLVEGLAKRAKYSLIILKEYAKALKNVRESGIPDFVNFKNGV